MSRLTRTLSAVALTLLTGCQLTLPVETTTPLPTLRRLWIDTATETGPLLERLVSGYREQDALLEVHSQVFSHSVLMRRIAQGETSYGLTLHAPNDPTFWVAPLAYDALIVLVHPDNPVTTLTPDDLRRVYSGVTRTWSPESSITVFSWPSGAALRSEFDRQVMGRRRLVTTAQILPTSAAMQRQLAQTPGGIAYIPYSQWQPTAGGRIVAIDGIMPTPDTLISAQYPLRLTVYLVGKTAPQGDAAAFFAWVQSRSGQTRLRPAYIPLVPSL